MAAAGTWAFDVDGTLIGSIRSDRLVAACYSKDRRDDDGRYLVEHFRSAHRPDVLVDDVPVLDAVDQHLEAAAPAAT